VKIRSRSGRLNARLKAYARVYNVEGTPSRSKVDGTLDLSLVKSRFVEPHVYGTVWALRIHPKTLIRYMRISDLKGEGWAVVRKYINSDRSSEAEEYSRMTENHIGRSLGVARSSR
jgi:hypothetical protein